MILVFLGLVYFCYYCRSVIVNPIKRGFDDLVITWILITLYNQSSFVLFQMTYLQGKTPISFLQELCTKRGITPTYDLIANEGAVHEPTFVFKVTAGDFIGTGKGNV